MSSTLDSPLVGSPAHQARAAVVRDRAHAWSWHDIHAAAAALATRLDDRSTVCNLCDTRVGFLVTWLAAMRRRCPQVLPPSGGRSEIHALLRAVDAATVVVDDEAAYLPQWSANSRSLVLGQEFLLERRGEGEIAWSPPWDLPLLRLYTSGSTGTPEPHVKTLRQFVLGAQALGQRLRELDVGGLDSRTRIVCSVASQHMFGVEAAVMLSLVHGMPVQEGCPLLPADVAAAFETVDGGAVWVATPVHLRALAASGHGVAHCDGVIASTMPLAPGLAARTEDLVGAPVVEIYGSTETGAVATRRTAHHAGWTPLRDVRVESTSEGTRAWGSHFHCPVLLSDETEGAPDGSFRLLGRHADMIKIGGRRTSLAGLNLLLQDLPGLGDGTFFLPAGRDSKSRLVLIHDSQSLDLAAAKAWLRERIDPVFMPRVFICVDRLPRTRSGKLPRTALEEAYAAWQAKRPAR